MAKRMSTTSHSYGLKWSPGKTSSDEGSPLRQVNDSDQVDLQLGSSVGRNKSEFLMILAIELTSPSANIDISRSFFASLICVLHIMMSGTGINSQSVTMCKLLVARLTLSSSRHWIALGSALCPMTAKEYSAAIGLHMKALRNTQRGSRNRRRAR